jgi:hypothetical protein
MRSVPGTNSLRTCKVADEGFMIESSISRIPDRVVVSCVSRDDDKECHESLLLSIDEMHLWQLQREK